MQGCRRVHQRQEPAQPLPLPERLGGIDERTSSGHHSQRCCFHTDRPTQSNTQSNTQSRACEFNTKMHAYTSHDTRQIANRNHSTVTNTHTRTYHDTCMHAHMHGQATRAGGRGNDCSASLQGEEAAGLPCLTMLVYGHEHDGVNTGGHDQVHRAATNQQ